VHIDKTIPEIREALFEYVTNCRSLGNISVDPTGQKRIVMTETGPGWTQTSAYAVFDVDADEHGGSNLQGYTYYRLAASSVNTIARAINDPKKCDGTAQ
jgi:hypothetical protein